MWGEGQTCQVHSSITCHLLLQESSSCWLWKRPSGSQLLPFPPKSAVAPLIQHQQHFLQLCPCTADGTRLTASSGSDQELLDCRSLPHSSLWGRRVPAAPSMSPPSPSAETPWYSWRPNTCSLPALSCPTTEAALTLAGLEGRCSPAKGTPGWTRSPCSFSQAVTSSTGPRCTQDWRVRDLSLCHRTVQVCTASYGENFLTPWGAPDSFMALTHCSTAWLPQATFSIKPRTAEL